MCSYSPPSGAKWFIEGPPEFIESLISANVANLFGEARIRFDK